MKYTYAVYLSGRASTIQRFYQEHDKLNFPVSLVYYDGEDEFTMTQLSRLFGDILINATKRKSEFKNGFLHSKFISEEMNKFLVEKNIDYLFCFGNTILRSPLLNNYKNRIVNFHPSILPSFPGLMAIDQALASGVQFLGNTAHIINKGIDTGPIIMQSVLKRQAYSKYEDVLNLQIPMLEKIWLLLDGDNLEVGENFVQINSEGSQYNSFFSV